MTNAQLEELQALVAEYQPLRHHEVVHFLKCSFRTAPAQPNGWVREYVPRMIRTLLDNLEVLNAENERLRGARLLAAGFADQFRRGLVEIRDVPGIDARAAARNTLASVKETTRE